MTTPIFEQASLTLTLALALALTLTLTPTLTLTLVHGRRGAAALPRDRLRQRSQELARLQEQVRRL